MKVVLFSCFFVLIWCQASLGQCPDLRLLQSAHGDTTWVNPDSVKADSCSSSVTYGQLYAKGWFNIEFTYYILPTPIGPEDTIIDRTWHDIDTQYANVRAAFNLLEQKYSSFMLRKIQPHWTDTASGGNKLFTLWFDDYVNIDSMITELKAIPLVEWVVYAMRAGRYLASVSKDEQNIYSAKKVVLSRSSSEFYLNELLQPCTETARYADIFSLNGKHLSHLDRGIDSKGIVSKLLSLSNGSYLVSYGTCMLFCNVID